MTTRYAATAAALAALCLALAGCSDSGGDEPEPPPETKAAPSDKDSGGPPRVQGGVASPDSLRDFECGPDDDGTWGASGEITNSDQDAQDYRVTIVVAPPSAATGQAREITLAGVGGGESEKFATDKLPIVDGDEPTCSVQVARLT